MNFELFSVRYQTQIVDTYSQVVFIFLDFLAFFLYLHREIICTIHQIIVALNKRAGFYYLRNILLFNTVILFVFVSHKSY